MNIDKFGEWTDNLWNNYGPADDKTLFIITVGLAGESGEVCEVIKKHVRDNEFDKEDLKLELGDVLHYWCRICSYFGLKPSEVAEANQEKLTKRYADRKMKPQ